MTLKEKLQLLTELKALYPQEIKEVLDEIMYDLVLVDNSLA